ncbi:hypothetical protein RI129_007859 [Pyrocoelia pectoralis]|uniref:Uncharacterized protein n=1 Tax=Pyrocoelia pectoralis TaxID=417401 RepID=A0AAN7VIE9_9COLE
MTRKNMVPPDGGWGWVIVVAYALFNFLIIPALQNFGLIFQGKFKELQLSATDESFVVTSGLAIGMLAGLSYGPLLKRYSFRIVCAVSGFLVSVGIITLMFASAVYHFVISYGIITSIGLSLGMTGYSYALNSYFLKRRSFATGFAFTITCLGSIAMPQLISFLLFEYGVSGTCLLIGGLSLNSFVSATLLQPVEWHLKEDTTAFQKDGKWYPVLHFRNNFPLAHAKKRVSIYTISLDELPSQTPDVRETEGNGMTAGESTTTISSDPNLRVIEEKRSAIKVFFYSLVNVFDLSLLRDKSFLNLLFGISFGAFAEQSFSVLTPFILADLGMGIQQIATFISVLSLSDLIFRFITPFIGNYFKMTSRVMCMISFALLMISRACLLLPLDSYAVFMIVALGIGVAKGIRTVYWTLVIPDYVPIKMLPSATGFHMVLNGFFLLIGGPILGKYHFWVAKEISGNYVNCIYITNAITLLALMMWLTEMIYKKCKQSKDEEEVSIDIEYSNVT